MPVIQSLMDKLVKQYGAERGKRVYYAMEAEGKGPFAAGNKGARLHEDFARKHGVEPINDEGKKKPRAAKRSARGSGPRGKRKPTRRR